MKLLFIDIHPLESECKGQPVGPKFALWAEPSSTCATLWRERKTGVAGDAFQIGAYGPAQIISL
jgi:hypothetical protein